MNKTRIRTLSTLTYAGILPFLLLSIAVMMKIKGYDYDLALRAYGAVIISFLCGIHWATYLFFSDKCSRNLFLYSNAITLTAYGSMVLSSHPIGFIVQSLCLIFLLKIDYELMRKDLLPIWYFNLRRNATLAVIIVLLTTACFS